MECTFLLCDCKAYLTLLTPYIKDSAVWNEAKRFYHAGRKNVFQRIGKAAPSGSCDKIIRKLLKDGEEAGRQKADRPHVDKRALSGDLAAVAYLPPISGVLSDEGTRKLTPLAETPVAEKAEEDELQEKTCYAGKASEANSSKIPKVEPGKSNSKDGKHGKFVPPQSASIETKQSATESLPSTRPRPPYKQNVVGRMIWLRPKPEEKFWIRGRIEKCEQSRVDEVGENGKVESCEFVYHVVKCTDDGTLCRVQLQQVDQLENLVWM